MTDEELEQVRVELARRDREATDRAFKETWDRGREACAKLIPYWEGVVADIKKKGFTPITTVPMPPGRPEALRVIARLEGRRDMVRRTSVKHPDETVRREASTRASAYDVAVDDAREILGVKA